MDADRLLTALEAEGFTALAERLGSLARPSGQIHKRQVGPAHLWASKLGGHPDLPALTPWPTWHAAPLGFLAQIDLADLSASGVASPLPPSGLLSFFYHPDQQTWGFSPDDHGSFRVLYIPDPMEADLRRTEAPAELPSHALYPEAPIRFEAVRTLPPLDWPEVGLDSLSSDDRERVWGLYDEIAEQEIGRAAHRLFGHPVEIQGDMRFDCQLTRHGIDLGDGSGYRTPQARALAGGIGAWQLLLQIDSDDALDMMWGDAGMLYFWMHEDDLAALRFEDAWMVLQCS